LPSGTHRNRILSISKSTHKPAATPAAVDRRLRRSAAALGDVGVRIPEWLHQPEQRATLVKAAETGLPSVAGISPAFAAKFGKNAGKAVVIRQFIGRAVKHIMQDEGYVPGDLGVKLPGDKVFKTGTRYRLRGEAVGQGAESPLLERLVSALNPHELRQLEQIVRRKSLPNGHTRKSYVALPLGWRIALGTCRYCLLE
jgi:hypothetical protein